jgi:alpha,alpha-trehalase
MIAISKETYSAVIFDLDGVITKTAKLHIRAWKALFDEYFERLRAREGKAVRPFDPDRDYRVYVDGKPRYEGVRSLLASRDIDLPYGSADDEPDRETICGLGNRKNELFHANLETYGVEVYEEAIDLVRALRSKGFKTAIVSSSKNCLAILQAADLVKLFDVRVDGKEVERLGLSGKPAPDVFFEAAQRLDVTPAKAVVVEDAAAGVEAGSRGGFGRVLGVDRDGQARTLKDRGADAVVRTLKDISIEETSVTKEGGSMLKSAIDSFEEVAQEIENVSLALFLDYDGTLTPIVDRPEDAHLSPDMRDTLKEMTRYCPVAILSGRDLPDVRSRVGIEGLYYAGSHGFDISGPHGRHMERQEGTAFLPALDSAEGILRRDLEDLSGVMLERKRFSIAVHYRKAEEKMVPKVEKVVDRVSDHHSDLRKSRGKKIFELQPDVDWNKGKALLWLLEALSLDRRDVREIYIGDDTTDEDAFSALRPRQGIGILVTESPRPTAASYVLADTRDVRAFLKKLIRNRQGGSV